MTSSHQYSAAISAGSLTGAEQEAVRSLKRLMMKRLTWLVLIAYSLLLVKPVVPIAMDVLAHTFWEQQHLLTVHEINGKFHLHNELVRSSHQSEKDKQSASSKVECEQYLPTFSFISRPVISFLVRQDMYPHYQCFYCHSLIRIDNPPPEAGI